MSRKEYKEDTVDDVHADNEDNIEEEESEVTVMEIDDLRNECMRETEENTNRRLLRNHEMVNKGCSRKKKSPVWAFFLPFQKMFARMYLSGIIARCAILLSRSYCRKQ